MGLFNKKVTALAISIIFPIGYSTQSQADGLLGDLFNSGPCSNQARDWGRVIGGIGGYVIGDQVGDGKTNAKIIGLAIGTLVGNAIGKDIDRRRCEVYKIAQQHHLDVEFEDIKIVSTDPSSSSSMNPSALDDPQPTQNTGAAKPGKLGQVLRWGGLAHFEPNSSKLTQEAKEYFSQVADQYVADIQIPAIERDIANQQAQDMARQQAQGAQPGQQQKIVQLSDGDREKLRQHYKGIQIVLTGHTDDTGSSELNAKLAEKRARTVAALFESRGVPVENLYFQGAGETQPIADNRTEVGRAKNRRVEVVEIDSPEKLASYLSSRKSNIEFYRPRQEEMQVVAQNETPVEVERQVAFDEIAPVVIEVTEKPAQKKPDSKQGKQKKNKKGTINTENEVAQKKAEEASLEVAAANAAAAATVAAAETKLKTQQAENRFVEIDFGGIPADKDNSKEIMASFGEVVGKQPNLIAKLSSFFVKEAQATPEQIYSVSCLKDSPRYSGDVISLKSGKKLEYKTRDYLPGLYETSWTDAVNGHLVALTHVGVLRDGATPPNNQEMFIYINNAKPGSDAQADVKNEPMVNVYGGTKGVLYRIFSRDKSNNVVCGDVVFPYAPPFEAKSGRLLYRKDGGVYSAEFKPRMVR